MSYNKNRNAALIRYGSKESELDRQRHPLMMNMARTVVVGFIVFVFAIMVIMIFNQHLGKSTTMECTIIAKTSVNDFPMIDTTCGTFSVNSYSKWSQAITGNTYTMEVVDGSLNQIPVVRNIK